MIIVLMLWLLQIDHPRGRVTIERILTASEQEQQEGYFGLGTDLALVVRPGSDLHMFLKAKVDMPVRLVVEPQ